jgi:hypothetical protein
LGRYHLAVDIDVRSGEVSVAVLSVIIEVIIQ